MVALSQESEVKSLIIELNTQNQLYQDGIDSNGKDLVSRNARPGQVYANFTINEKALKRQPYDRVTLFDTGFFYNSFNVKLDGFDLKINADTNKESGDLIDTWGPILGLTDESKTILNDYIRNIINDIVKKELAL